MSCHYTAAMEYLAKIPRSGPIDPDVLEKARELCWKRDLIPGKDTDYMVHSECPESKRILIAIRNLCFNGCLEKLIRKKEEFPKHSLCEILAWICIAEYILMMRKFMSVDEIIKDPTSIKPHQPVACSDLCKLFKENTVYPVEPEDNEFTIALVIRLRAVYEQVLESFGVWVSERYRMQKTKELHDQIFEELIRTTWHPRRVEWWTDFEEYREIFG